jgi:hypothetical protein
VAEGRVRGAFGNRPPDPFAQLFTPMIFGNSRNNPATHISATLGMIARIRSFVESF